MQKPRFRVHAIFGSTGSVFQKYMVTPIVEFLRLDHSRR